VDQNRDLSLDIVRDRARWHYDDRVDRRQTTQCIFFPWGYNQIVTNESQTAIDNFYFFRIPFTYEKRCKRAWK
jgi:hypothetical protein